MRMLTFRRPCICTGIPGTRRSAARRRTIRGRRSPDRRRRIRPAGSSRPRCDECLAGFATDIALSAARAAWSRARSGGSGPDRICLVRRRTRLPHRSKWITAGRTRRNPVRKPARRRRLQETPRRPSTRCGYLPHCISRQLLTSNELYPTIDVCQYTFIISFLFT